MLVLLCEQCGELQGLELIQNMSEENRDMFNQGKGCPSCINKPHKTYNERADDTAIARYIQKSMRDIHKGDLEGLAEEVEYLGLV